MALSILNRIKNIFRTPVAEIPKLESSVIEKPIGSLSLDDLFEEEVEVEQKPKFISRDPEPKKEYILSIIDKAKKPLSITEIVAKGQKFSHVTIRRYVKILTDEGVLQRDKKTLKYSRVNLKKG